MMNLNQLMNFNPVFVQAMKMAQGKNPQELEQIARNICKERGLDYDQMFSQFKQQKEFFDNGFNRR